MIIYLLKFIACTGLLLLFYYGVLQNDRLFRFNRLFLLAIVILALVIPITIVRTKVIEIPISQEPVFSQIEAPILDNAFVLDIPTTFESTSEPSISWEKGLWINYLLVTSILLFRFSRNLHSILRLKRQSLIVAEEGIKIVLRTDIKASFSFLNHMYTNRTRYEQGNLPTEIIEHEKHHIDQKHSYDIIYIELLQCVLWFNPFIYLIKAAIKLNHEFLADQHVLKDNTSVYDYQKILLDITRKQFVNTPAFASNLNYGFTKKRLNMMTKNTNKVKSMIKQVAAAGIIAGAFSIGGETKVIAQEIDIPVNLDVTVSPELDESLYKEREIDLKVSLTKQDTINPKKLKRPSSMVQGSLVRFKDKDGELVQAKYKALSEEQKARFLEKESEGQFFLPPPPKGVMNQALLDDFMNPEKYGVWIDGKRINNDKLKTYSPSDFHHFTKSTLLKNAKNYGKYTFHLSLTSIKYFESKGLTKGKWLDLSTPTIIEIPEQKTAKDKRNQEPMEVASVRSVKAKPQVIEVKSVREEKVKKKPQVIEVKSVREEKIKEKPQVIEVKSVQQEKVKAKSKSEQQNKTDKFKDGTVTQKLLDEVESNNRYWLSIDGQFVKNNILKNYKPEDFYDYFKSGIAKESKQAETYDFEIDLVTMNTYNTEKALFDKNMTTLSKDILVLNDIPEGMQFNLMNKKSGFEHVRFIDHGGKLIEGHFGSFPRKQKQRFYWLESYGQFFVNYSDLAIPEMTEVRELIDNKYTIKIDGKTVDLETLNHFSRDSFSHALQYVLFNRENREDRIKAIDFITKANPILKGSPKGLWVSL